MNKDRQQYGFMVGSQLQTGNRKIQCHFVGSLAIYKCISPNHILLMSLDGVLYPMFVEEARLKPGVISTHKCPVRTQSELRNAAKIAYRPDLQVQCIVSENSVEKYAHNI